MKLIYKNSSQLSDKEILKIAKPLKNYVTHLQKVAKENNYEAWESSINLSFDKNLAEAVTDLVQRKVSDELQYVVVVGIGGSNLGTKAIYDCQHGHFDLLEESRFPKMIFVDTTDGEYAEKLEKLIKTLNNPHELLVNVVCKSGTTTEVIANAEFILKVLVEYFGDEAFSRVVVTADNESDLYKLAEEKGIDVLEIPKKVGGRFSVLSAVGLFPLAAVGIDVDNLREGAREIRKACLDEDVLKNPAIISAAILFSHYKAGKIINDNFVFNPKLESLGKWYRQLMGESIGKNSVGFFPTVSVGSIDLHSVGQLYLGDSKNQITTFIYSESSSKAGVSKNQIFPELIKGIKGKSFAEITEAIFKGVKVAYVKHEIPFMEVELENLETSSVGEFLQFKMMEMMYLAKLLDVNAFDQPNVESYKAEVRKIL